MGAWRLRRDQSTSTPRDQKRKGATVAALTPMALVAFWVALHHFRHQEQIFSAALADNAAPGAVVNQRQMLPALVGTIIGPQSPEAVESTQKLFDWLATGTAMTSMDRIQFENDDAAMASLAATNGVRLAILSAEDYIGARQIVPDLELLATELRWDDERSRLIDSTTIYIVSLKSRSVPPTSAESPASRLRVAFTSRDSLNGYRYPTALLAHNGIATGTYDETFTADPIDALLTGSADFAAVTDVTLRKAQARSGDVFQIVHQSAPLPHRCIVARPPLPADVRAKIVKMLVDIDPKLIEGLGAHGFVRRPDAFYDTTRQLLNIPSKQ